MITLIKKAAKLCVLTSAFLSCIASAEEANTVELPVELDAIEEIRFKNIMETRLNRDIEAYLGDNRFIVYVDAKLKKTRTMVNGGNANEGGQAVSSQPLPSLSSLSPIESGNNPASPGEQKEILPGLPTSGAVMIIEDTAEIMALKQRVQQLDSERQQAVNFANNMQNNVRKPVKTNKKQLLGFRNTIKELTITVMLDAGLDDQQVEFLRNLVTRKAGMDEVRGDTLKIVRTEFNHAGNEVVTPTWWQKNQNWVMLACFGFLILLLVLAMFIFNRRLMESLHDSQHQKGSEVGPITNNLALDLASSEKELQSSLSELKQSLVTIGLGQPQVFQQLIAEQLNSGNLTAVGTLFGVLGETLFRSLYPQLLISDRETLVQQVQNQSENDNQKANTLKNLHHELLQSLGNLGSQKSPFEFLDKLNDSQVLYLLKEEETRIKALILSQVSSQRAATLIHRLEADEQAAVAYEIGEFETLPVSTFRDVADRLAKKSLTVPSFKNISANGLAVLINMLDTMNGGEEAKLLKSLKTDKPETYYRLRQSYYTFADLARTPELTISNELRDIDRTIMALSLCHTPLDFKRYVLSGLPAKLRSSVIAELKAQEEEGTQEQIEQARDQVVSRMRSVIKAGRFSMDDLTVMAKAG